LDTMLKVFAFFHYSVSCKGASNPTLLQLFHKTLAVMNTTVATAGSVVGQPKSRVQLSLGCLMQLVRELRLLKASRLRTSCLR
jgi:hypothetical protein